MILGEGGWANGPKLYPLDFPPVSRELWGVWGVGGWGARVLCWAGLVMKLQVYNYKMVHAISKFRPVEATRQKRYPKSYRLCKYCLQLMRRTLPNKHD